jgi:uncharacterized repeat protein (TIGR04042 family)
MARWAGQQVVFAIHGGCWNYLQPGDILTVAELEQRGLDALHEASERVRARYGFACSRTDEEAQNLRRLAANYGNDESVRVTRVTP